MIRLLKRPMPCPEYAVGALKIEPRWDGKFCIMSYRYCDYSVDFYWSEILDGCQPLRFDTKKEALNRIRFMGLENKYIYD